MDGTAVVDFGAFPGSLYAYTVITGQTGILTSSKVEAWILPATTVEHSADDHIIDPPRVLAANIVADVGFTIHALAYSIQQVLDNPYPFAFGTSLGQGAGEQPREVPMHWGRYNVGWVWKL